MKTKPGTTFKLSLVVVSLTNLIICRADYTLRTKNMAPVNISLILTPAFARMTGSGNKNSDFVGFIPELLKALNKRQGLWYYKIVEATDNVIGQKLSNGNWTGLMHDVISGKSKVIGAGPILYSDTYKSDANLSIPWATVHLTLVVKKTLGITTVKEALDRQMTILAVSDSPELDEVRRKVSRSLELSNLLNRINQSNRFVDTVEKGLEFVAKEDKTGLLMNTEEARYYVTHDFCSVDNFHLLGEYVFALDPTDKALETLNQQLSNMKADGSLDLLRKQELGISRTCSRGSVFHLEKIVAFLFATATVIFVQVLS